MGAYFSGVVQSPMTAGDHHRRDDRDARSMLLPLLVATVLAYHASRLVCPVSLYEALAPNFSATRLRSTSGKTQDLVHQ